MIRFLLPLALLAPPVVAGEADVVAATATHLGGTSWEVEATIQHPDETTTHYANAFEVLGPDGAILGTRTLWHHHPAQPFSRSKILTIPEGIAQITVRAVDSVHGHGGAETVVELQ